MEKQMSEIEIPNFGELLLPYIAAVPAQAVPNFLALLERGAAQRYREWADMLPEHRDGLLECSSREDEIADIVQALFPLDDALQLEIEALLPPARDAYYAVFADMPVENQLAIQANAELQGAAAWRGMIDESTPAELQQSLQRCSQLEETSSAYLQEILG
jgi:hypothetical protein